MATHEAWDNYRQQMVPLCEACARRVNDGLEGERFDGSTATPLKPDDSLVWSTLAGKYGPKLCSFDRHPEPS